jgi:hypothetical protein
LVVEVEVALVVKHWHPGARGDLLQLDTMEALAENLVVPGRLVPVVVVAQQLYFL